MTMELKTREFDNEESMKRSIKIMTGKGWEVISTSRKYNLFDKKTDGIIGLFYAMLKVPMKKDRFVVTYRKL